METAEKQERRRRRRKINKEKRRNEEKEGEEVQNCRDSVESSETTDVAVEGMKEEGGGRLWLSTRKNVEFQH